MIKKNLIILFFVSCTNLLLYQNPLHSIHLTGSAWVEINKTDDFTDNIFSIEIWFSLETSDNIQTILSIIDEDENVNFGLFIDPINTNHIQVRHENNFTSTIELDDSLFNDSFYYIVVVSSENTDIYINGQKMATINSNINLDNNIIALGAKTNRSHSIQENYFYGYIDEARLWNTNIDPIFIALHQEYPNKISEFSDDEILENLFGLWRFNNSNGNYSHIIEDQTCQTINILYDDYVCTIDNEAIIYTTGTGRVEYSDKHK